jgi:hypothetical protein
MCNWSKTGNNGDAGGQSREIKPGNKTGKLELAGGISS